MKGFTFFGLHGMVMMMMMFLMTYPDSKCFPTAQARLAIGRNGQGRSDSGVTASAHIFGRYIWNMPDWRQQREGYSHCTHLSLVRVFEIYEDGAGDSRGSKDSLSGLQPVDKSQPKRKKVIMVYGVQHPQTYKFFLGPNVNLGSESRMSCCSFVKFLIPRKSWRSCDPRSYQKHPGPDIPGTIWNFKTGWPEKSNPWPCMAMGVLFFCGHQIRRKKRILLNQDDFAVQWLHHQLHSNIIMMSAHQNQGLASS